jgi:hypothetical protein
MRYRALPLPRGMRVIFALLLLGPLFGPSLVFSGVPHMVYFKVFNEGGGSPSEESTLMYAFNLARPGEVLNKSSVGNGYKVVLDSGWAWVETGNYVNPWSVGEKLRLIVIDTLTDETNAVDIVLGGSGTQLLSDLHLLSGDHVGPRTYGTLVNGSNPASITFGTSTFTLTATIDDSLSGNSALQGAEFFVDNDPGPGLGAEMQAKDGIFDSPQEDVTKVVDASPWASGSPHTIYVRGKDAAGNWGTTHKVLVSVWIPLPGDANGDDKVDTADIFYLINTLFAGGPAPIGDGDANGDGKTNVKDIFYLINYLFANGPPPT